MPLPALLALLALANPEGKPTVFAQHAPLALRAASANRASLPRFGKLELTLDLAATYDNPFDPDDVDVSAEFTSPQGKTVRVNGFLFQEYTRQLVNGRDEKLEPIGKPVWKVRFAPDAVGTWRYRVQAKDRTGTVRLPEAQCTVTVGTDPGFVGRSRRNPAMFAFADETPFFAVGENMCWAGGLGTYDFDTWLASLGKAGGNWIRIWMNNFNTTLEWSPETREPDAPTWGYHGLGAYSLDHAWKLDTMLDTAEQHGVYAMLCFGTYGEFTTGGFFGEGQWPKNPYNAANGGPCAQPADFWTNPTARKLYRQRLRYILARYGYRTHIQAWEFWNEANAPAYWVEDMASYIKGVGVFAGPPADPFRHLVSTTYGDDAVWKLPEIDFTMTHNYGTGNIPDHAPVIHNDAAQFIAYGKPHLMAEFGIDWRDTDRKYDPNGKGVNLHNGLWASAMSGNAGGAMLWWWDNYVAPENLYTPFVAFRRFTDTVHWTAGPWKPLEFDPPRTTDGPETFTDLTIPSGTGWGKAAQSDFTVTPQGLAGSAALPEFLYSPSKADLRTTPTFHVRYSHPGRFALQVNTVSSSSRIRILVDGKPIRELNLSAVPPTDPNRKPEYQKTEFKQEYGIYQAVFHKEYAIEVPAGAHTVTLENVEGDWTSLDSITLSGYRSSRYPNVNLYGQIHGQEAIVWAQNAAHNWKNVAEGKAVPVIKGASTTLHGLPRGTYTIAWWDTHTGEITKTENVAVRSETGDLPLHLPDLATDVAAHITPQPAR